jgi:hypothetical protein
MTRYAPLWQQGGSYAASTDRGLMSTLWPSGGVTGGAVSAVTNTMTVSVAPGVVAVPLQAGQGVALCRWDAAEVPPALAAAPPSGQSRIDVIVAQVRDNALDAGGNNDFVFAVVTGTPATTGSQVAPATPTNAYAMAQVLVGPGVANLNAATITDKRGGLAPHRLVGRMTVSAPTGFGGTLTTIGNMVLDTAVSCGLVVASAAWLYVPVAGLYRVSVAATITGTTGGSPPSSAGYVNIYAQVNGANVRTYNGFTPASAIQNPTYAFTDILALNANDSVSLAAQGGALYVMAGSWLTLEYLGPLPPL